MSTQIDWLRFNQVAPVVVATLRALSKAIEESGLEKGLLELVKVRASQLNGCAFCLGMHVEFARKAGVSQRALDLVATFREAEVFGPREKAALAWTEALTLMAHSPAATVAYERLAASFCATEIAHLTAAIGLINAWNRIAGGLRFAPVAPGG